MYDIATAVCVHDDVAVLKNRYWQSVYFYRLVLYACNKNNPYVRVARIIF